MRTIRLRSSCSEVLPAGVAALSYGIGNTGAADVRGGNLVQDAAGTKLRLSSPWGNATLRSPLLGDFNALNLLAALTAALQAGMPFDAMVAAVQSLQPMPGRMEPLRAPGAPLVVIDYAHTPDALSKVLESPARAVSRPPDRGVRLRRRPRPRQARADGRGRVRSRGLRGGDQRQPAQRGSAQIIADIEAAMRGDYRVEVDRAAAIAAAIQICRPRRLRADCGQGSRGLPDHRQPPHTLQRQRRGPTAAVEVRGMMAR
jgi:UDP-N-acetylmuramoyl-L-alanyl-D-glutamate--2,6-diaminopimelate ligase